MHRLLLPVMERQARCFSSEEPIGGIQPRWTEDVLDGDDDHYYVLAAYVVAYQNGNSAESDALFIDVYELWITAFRDFAEQKDWKVCVGEDIEYEATASSDCTGWNWDMEDGTPDAWNPTGGNAKSGSMQIPYTDSARASNSWFGDVYGIVNVLCEDGDGNDHHLYSHNMTPSRKAKVFFNPDLNVNGGAPSTASPPCWYIFWKDGGVVQDMALFGYNQDGSHANIYGYWNGSGLYLCPLACKENSGPETLNDMNGNPFSMTGTGHHLDCVAETIIHEEYHKYVDDTWGSSPGSDSDGLPDGEENTPSQTYFPVSNPNNYNTFNYTYDGTFQDQEVRCRIREIQAKPATYPANDWSMDSENPQW